MPNANDGLESRLSVKLGENWKMSDITIPANEYLSSLTVVLEGDDFKIPRKTILSSPSTPSSRKYRADDVRLPL